MKAFPDIAIIGPGRVGTALGVLAAGAGMNVRAVGGRNAARTRRAARRIGKSVRACSVDESAGCAGLILLTVPDDALAELAGELARSACFRKGAIVVHCSGALPSSVLCPLARQGCRIASVHPLQTFPTVDAAVDKLPGAYFFCEGDSKALPVLVKFISAIGGKPVRIHPRGKALYHASAVMACNHLVTLLDAARRLAGRAGVKAPIALKALAPLVRSTVENVLAMGPGEALTGPVVRGDAQTVRRHVDAIAAIDKGELTNLYRTLARATAGLASRSGRLESKGVQDVMAAIEGGKRPRKRSQSRTA